jgi:hypothetical protein
VTAAWPTDLPFCPMLSTQQVADMPATTLTEMNAGTTRARRKYSAPMSRMGFALRMTSAQAVAFRSFHESTLEDGALAFTMPIAFAGVLRTETVQFAEPPSYAALGPGQTRVTISLRVRSLGSGSESAPSDFAFAQSTVTTGASVGAIVGTLSPVY